MLIDRHAEADPKDLSLPLFAQKLVMLFSALGAVMVGLVALSINVDVFSRALFDAPVRGITEFVSLSMPLLVFLTLPVLVRNREMIRAGVISRWFPAERYTFVRVLEAFYHLIAAMVATAIVVAVGPWLWRALRRR